MVEHLAVNQASSGMRGSIPRQRTNFADVVESRQTHLAQNETARKGHASSTLAVRTSYTPVAQWIRALRYERGGCRFESCRGCQLRCQSHIGGSDPCEGWARPQDLNIPS